MKTMLLDTSTSILFVSFFDGDKNIFRRAQFGRNNHSDHLLETIKEGLRKTNLEVKDFSRIVCGIGPGAYTGLRVSLTVAKMFAWTLNIPLFTFSSLDFLASAYLKQDGIYSVMSHAKKGHIYGKVLEVKNGQIMTKIKETFSSIEDFEKLVAAYNIDVTISEENVSVDEHTLLMHLITEVHEIVSLEPNYLRGEL